MSLRNNISIFETDFYTKNIRCCLTTSHMKRFLLVALFFSIGTCLCHNEFPNKSKFNLDLEIIENGIPVGWSNNEYSADGYLFSLDSLSPINGKHSVSLEYHAGNINFSSWSYVIPSGYEGKRITLSGYIKTKNVQHGYAGLWMRLDPSMSLNNMSDQGVIGTTGWKKYTISLDLQSNVTKKIVIGGILKGTGKAWFGDFSIEIDGKDIRNLIPKISSFAASTDNEFNNGSGISEIVLTEHIRERIQQLGLIWGFIKYYHPAVAAGQHNMDSELFRILPKVLKMDSKCSINEIFVKWIESLGEIGEAGEEYINNGETFVTPDLGWIEDNHFPPELINLLFKIKDAKRSDKGYYISKRLAGNISFDHEEKYANMKYPDAGYRLLTLFRYWNMIEYFFPHKHLIGENWKDVLEEFIPAFVDAKNEREYVLTVLKLITRINDTHAQLSASSSVLLDFKGQRQTLPQITFVDNMPVISGFINDSLRFQTGLELGDVILSIGNRPVGEIIGELLPYTPASNYPTKLRNIATDLIKSNEEYIDIEYLRGGNRAKTRISTYSQDNIKELFSFSNNQPDTCFVQLTPTISYLYTGKYKNSYIFNLWKYISSSEGLIIDLRCYPGEFMVYPFGALLVPKPTTFCKVTTADIQYPGSFSFTSSGSIGYFNPSYYKGKVVILINENTQSQAEFTAMAFRVAPQAIVIGSTTAGADGDISIINLPGGLSTIISGMGIFYPDGRETQRIGIIPDIEICPTIEGIKAGRDELLEKAIEIIQN